MIKYGDIYKKKLNESETQHENKVLTEFKVIYNTLLEHYNLKSVHQLNENSQTSFLTELSKYWDENNGLSEKGKNFLLNHETTLNENSTSTQKKNFLREKSYLVINETLRQSNIKYKLYDIIDEMYNQLNASNIREILTPDMITNIISESFSKSLNEFVSNVNLELSESAKSVKVKNSMGKKYYEPSGSFEYYNEEEDAFYNAAGQKLRDPSEYNDYSEGYTPFGDE
ncbi:hypothetical protein M0Q50_10260 [bacterium]|jgi:hypothetical protein|nr:hypothetical protein [bacterium]